jgi:nucleotide-binding universal stress UspA family protein
MYKQIVVAIDGSELTPKVLEHAFALARYTKAKVHVVTVTEPSVVVAPGAELITVSTGELLAELEKAKAEEAKSILDKARAAADTAGVAIETQHIRQQHPSDGVIAAAESKSADLIVMGSHGRRGLNRLLLGSQANEVLVRAKVPVLVVK